MQFSKWVTLVFGALCLVAVAGVLGAQHLYYMAAILLTLPGVSYLLGWYTLRGITFRRELPASAWEGEEADLIYIAENATRITRFFLSISENYPAWIESLEGENQLFNIPANEESKVPVRVHFRRRGVYEADKFTVGALDPLGVFSFSQSVSCPGEVVVYPLPQQLRTLPSGGVDRYGYQEIVTEALRGNSVDPDGVRAYYPGDPLRRIHWRQTARTGKLSVIEFEESQSINLVIALDLRQGTDIGDEDDSTLEYGVRLAATLAYQAIQQGASVQLIYAENLEAHTGSTRSGARIMTGRGQQHLYEVLDALARVQATASLPISGLLLDASKGLQPGTSVAAIFSTPDPQLANALSHYTSQGARSLAIYVDPSSFHSRASGLNQPNMSSYFHDLNSVRANVYVVRKEEGGALRPEEWADALR